MKRKNAISGRTRLEKPAEKTLKKRRMGQMDYTFLTIPYSYCLRRSCDAF